MPTRRTAVALLVVVALAAGATPAPGAAPGGWMRPVDGEVVRPFAAPATPYGPGHRGVKLAAAPGTPVRAAGAGTVTFAGPVAGSLHVVVAHDGGLRTSYSYLGSIVVRHGESVARGAVVGRTGATDEHGPPGTLHFGLRRGDRYLDPMSLFEIDDLTELVRLVPATGAPAGRAWPASPDAMHVLRDVAPPPDWVRAAVGAGELSRRRGLPAVLVDAGGTAVGSVGRVVGWTEARMARLGTAALGLGGDVAARVVEWSTRHLPPAQAVADLAHAGRRFLDWVDHRRACDRSAPPADGTGGSRHSLMAVGGLGSATDPEGATFALDVEALGYDPDETHFFSYAPGGGDYGPEDTWGDLRAAGERLGAQLRARQRAAPGREVDLVAHSQGGVVVAWFLERVYDPTDPAYPPIGTVVTLAAPHRGTPVATVVDDLEATRTGAALLGLLGAAGLGLPAGDVTAQLSEHSALVRDLWSRGPYEQLRVTSIGASDDVVVPADRVDVPGATVVTVAVAGVHDHARIVGDPDALRVVRSALEGSEPPCVSLADGIRGAIVPVAIGRIQSNVGDAGTRASAALDHHLWWLG